MHEDGYVRISSVIRRCQLTSVHPRQLKHECICTDHFRSTAGTHLACLPFFRLSHRYQTSSMNRPGKARQGKALVANVGHLSPDDTVRISTTPHEPSVRISCMSFVEVQHSNLVLGNSEGCTWFLESWVYPAAFRPGRDSRPLSGSRQKSWNPKHTRTCSRYICGKSSSLSCSGRLTLLFRDRSRARRGPLRPPSPPSVKGVLMSCPSTPAVPTRVPVQDATKGIEAHRYE